MTSDSSTYRKASTVLPGYNSQNRDSVIKELLSIINHHGSLSIHEKQYCISIVAHKLRERVKDEKKH